MQRMILILCLLCIHWAARGQAGYSYRYWFDGDETTLRTGTSATPSWQMNLDLEGLEHTLHMLYFQVKDTVWSAPVTRYFMKVPDKGQQAITYWFDTRQENPRSFTPVNGAAMIDVSELEDGFHILYVQVTGQEPASAPHTNMFIKVPQTAGVDYLTCLFMVDNTLYKQEQVPSANGIVHWEFDASSITQGLHKAQGLIVTPSGAASNVQEGFFFRAMTTDEKASMQCYYSVDDAPHRTQAGKLDGNLFHFDLDVSDLDDGFHRLSYMLMSDNGNSSKVMSAFFFKTPLGGNGITRYEYWVNDNEDRMHVTTLDERTDPFKLITLLPVESCPIRSSCFQFEVENGLPVLYARNDLHMSFYDVSGRISYATERFVDYNVSREVTGIEPLTGADGQMRRNKPEENGILWYSMEAAVGDSLSIRSDKACTVHIFAPDGEEVYTASGAESVSFGGCHAYQDGTYYIALHDVTAAYGSDITLTYQHIDKYALLEYTPTSFGTPSTIQMKLFGNGFSDTTQVVIYNKDNVAFQNKTLKTQSLSELSAYFEIPDTLTVTYSLKVLYTANDSICIDNAINMEPKDSVPEISISLEGNPFFLVGTSATYQVKFINHSNIPVHNLPFTISIYCQDEENTISGLKFSEEIGKESKESFREWCTQYLNDTEIEELIQCLYGDDDLKHFFQWTDSTTQKTYLIGYFALPYLDANSTLSVPLTITKATHNFSLYASTKKNWDFINRVIRNGNRDDNNGNGNGGNGDGGDGSGGSGSGSGGSGSGSGGSGSGSNGSGSGGDGIQDDDECCVMWAATCLTTIIKSVIPMTDFVDAWTDRCMSEHAEKFFGGVFSDMFCEGNATDFTKTPRHVQSAQTDITQSVMQCSLENAFSIGGEAAVKKLLKKMTKGMSGKFFTYTSLAKDCIITPLKTWVRGCGDDDDDDADADPINSYDPNDIYGYQASSGSKAIKKDLKEVPYTIEFENDPKLATTSAHEVIVTDTLDRSLFDLNSFRPTSLRIGDRYVELDGTPSTIKTLDMRPEVNAIAQMTLSYNASKGIAQWKFISLDPMTMEPTDNPMSGFLPVNTDGNGIGEVSFRMALLPAFDDGVEISNRAAIVFDQNDPIITPTWTNITDTIAPTSTIAACEARNDSTMLLHFEGSDNRSGVWKYDLYAQEGTEAPWTKVAENIESDQYEFKGFSGINYGFCVVATDSAGNVEPKVIERELSQPTFKTGDANGDGTVDVLDATLATGKYLDKDVHLNFDATDANKDGLIDAMDVSLIRQIYLSTALRARNIPVPRTRIKTIR